MSGPCPEGTVDRASSRLRYVPALDGLRALAVLGVLLYHSDLGGWRGGFLGVDVFFVLSGYLITCLLVAGHRRTETMGLRRFWLARARRLLPALFLVLGVTCAYAALFLPHEAAKLRDDVLAALGYVTNWHLVFDHQSYFESTGRPSMLQHLWSLAVEEQFYLVWPFVLGAGLLLSRRHRARLAWVLLAAAGASALLMAVLYDPTSDPSRVHYGTDTHGMGLLVGAALALVWPMWRLTARTGRGAGPLLDLTGLAALGALVWCFANVSEFDPALYRGGYLVVSFLAALVVAVAVHPAAGLVGGLLGNRVLRWIGERSYGIYLWHWPVYLVTRPHLDVTFDGMPLLGLRLTITVTLAALSYRFVELPVRSGAVGRAVTALRNGLPHHRRRVARRIALGVPAFAAGVALLGVSMAAADPAPPPPGLRTKAVRIAVTTTTPESEPVRAVWVPRTPESTSTTTTTTTTAPPPAPVTFVTAIGDSVMLGARDALVPALGGNVQIDAAVSRQFDDALEVTGLLATAGQLGDRVIVHMGNNGMIRPEQFDELMRLLTGVPRVLVVNTAVPRPWEQPVNDLLAASVPNYPNALLVDWNGFASQHPDLFVGDGVHLTPGGAVEYAGLIAQHL
jgi:peptidoglycan/LPS O-acetylase OafA/YrhL